MHRERKGAVLSQVRTLFHVGTATGLTDDQLLERFAIRGGEASEVAFAALVERHGPMVLRVCRGVLNHPQDTQDAFQATFLVLVRQAASIRERASLASWLYGVAYRVALYDRAAAIRRTTHERRAAERAGAYASHETRGDDLVGVIHEEVARLPECYRAVILLCDLEGLTHEQAAGQLACPVGTVKSRLARGRGRLRARLTRRGLAPVVGSMLWASEESSAMPAALVDSTVRAVMRFAAAKGSAGTFPASVVALSSKVLWSMLMNKLKMVAIAMLVGIAITGAGTLALPAQEPQSKDGPVSAKKSHSQVGVVSRAKAPDRGDPAKNRSIGEEMEVGEMIGELAGAHAEVVLSEYAVEMAVEEIQVCVDLLMACSPFLGPGIMGIRGAVVHRVVARSGLLR